MNNPKNDAYYLQKILTDLHFINRHMKNVSVKALGDNELLLDSMMLRLIPIQENAKKRTDDFKHDRPSIPWTDIAGLRNRIVHDYGNVDLMVVHATLTEDIPWLTAKLEKN